MTLTNFTTYVKQTFKRTDKDTELTQAYNDSIIAVASHIPHGDYKYQSYVNLVVRQEDYALPTTIMHLFHPIRLLDGTTTTDSGYDLKHITKEEYDLREPNPNRTDPSTGSPSAYCIFSGSVLLTPIPDDATNLIEINWTKVPTDQSAGADTPALPDYWREVLKQMTLKRLYELIDLYEEASYWKSQYEDGAGNPVGLYRQFLDIEIDKESNRVKTVLNNQL